MKLSDLKKASKLAGMLHQAQANLQNMKTITVTITNALPVVMHLEEMPNSNFSTEKEARKYNERALRCRDYVSRIFMDDINEIKEELAELGVTIED